MKSIKDKNITFMGSPEIGAIVLEDLLKNKVRVGSVITRPDKPRGRGKLFEQTPVKILAGKHGITVYEPANKSELTDVIGKIKPDICIVAAYGMIIPTDALNIPRYGMINFHPSLLPELRGPAPIPMSIMCQDKKTGVTIIKITEEMDAGDILLQKEVTLNGRETTPKLSKKLAHLGAKMIIELLPDLFIGRCKARKQDESKATFTKMIKKDQGKIDWQNMSAVDIEAMSRAFTPWPGIYTAFNGKKLDLFDIEVIDNNIAPGKVANIENEMIIGTNKGAIAPKFLKLEGKNKVLTEEFLRGYPDITGAELT